MLDTVAADDNKYEKCNYGSHQKDNKVCYEDVKQWYPCTMENHYGYQSATPCVFLKLNKVIALSTDSGHSFSESLL